MLAFIAAVLPGVPTAQAAETVLERVKARGYVTCGVGEAAPGFSEITPQGAWRGFDIEFCTALGAAIFGKKDAVKFIGLTTGDRFKTLTAGDVDVLLRQTAWTLSRDTELGARFVTTLFHDGQGFLVPRSHSIASVMELSGASVCVLSGSSGERAVSDYFGQRRMRFQMITSDKWDELVKTYADGGCTVLTGDVSLLASVRAGFGGDGPQHMLLPELISKEPLGPVIKAGDDGWFAVVRWVSMALIAAEELGVTSANVESMRTSIQLDVRRFLGLEADLGAPLGLPRDWAYQMVKGVGNYAEVFERTLGQGSSLKLDRGLNNLWTKGGLLYPSPLR